MDCSRVVDVVLASAALIVLVPVMFVVALAVKLTSPGPILHRSQRVGRRGELFTLYKFRSMRVGAGTAGPGVTAAGDARIARAGRTIRRTKLDELPQLWNVVRGDMAIVGPRPEDPRYVALYTPPQRRILHWRPGLTSPASVTFRDEEAILARFDDLDAGYRDVMAQKLRIDLDYLDHRTWRTDLTWIWRTASAIVKPDGGGDG